MTSINLLAISLLVVINFSVIESQKSPKNDLQCKDENNKNVDWFVVYKLPVNTVLKNGKAYMYITSETEASGWKLSSKDVTSQDSLLANTLAPLYNGKDAAQNMWVLYNDHSPLKEDYQKAEPRWGHTKGVVMANKHGGFWLIHSVPRFPPSPNPPGKKVGEIKYKYPKSGMVYGQSFLCISVDATQIDVIAGQLMYNQIIQYSNNTNPPKALTDQYKRLVEASNHVRITKAPFNNEAIIKSSGGKKFRSFAKSAKWNRGLYAGFVGPKLKSDLLVQTPNKMPLPSLVSKCGGSRVMNVMSLHFELNENKIDFARGSDHSKWAISSTEKGGHWVCIGDINRAETQFNRGGGTVCLESKKLWSQYKNAVSGFEDCPKKT